MSYQYIYIGLIPEKFFFFSERNHLYTFMLNAIGSPNIYLMAKYKVVNKDKWKQKAEVMILTSD